MFNLVQRWSLGWEDESYIGGSLPKWLFPSCSLHNFSDGWPRKAYPFIFFFSLNPHKCWLFKGSKIQSAVPNTESFLLPLIFCTFQAGRRVHWGFARDFGLGGEVLAFPCTLPAFRGLLPINCLLIKVLIKERNFFSLVLDFPNLIVFIKWKDK